MSSGQSHEVVTAIVVSVGDAEGSYDVWLYVCAVVGSYVTLVEFVVEFEVG